VKNVAPLELEGGRQVKERWKERGIREKGKYGREREHKRKLTE